jgi:SH3 domain protein
MMRVITAFLLLTIAATFSHAETAYVTDQLRLGLHRAADTSDRSFRTLESGQEMEVLSRDRNYANVQLPDGTQGYVKAAYLVTEKPAKLIVNETQAEAERLRQELSRLQESFAQPAATIASLEQRLSEAEAALSSSESQVEELQQQNSDYVERYSEYKFSLPLKWVGGALLVSVLAGFLGGLWWTDYRSRKRHGGIRIY